MSKVNLLSEEVINKIAAGEVVERPASVVKELIENSLDAKATSIVVDIEDSGRKLIRITDNGVGMDEEDARKAILRHATSKIMCADDLYALQTLGFRGEALASIAAVSHFRMLTKQKHTLAGFQLSIEDGKIISSGIAPSRDGTTIEIRNLFYNTPARLKFLKTDAVELHHIVAIVERYALLHHAISFHLTSNGRTLLQAPAVADSRSNIASLFGVSVAKELLEISYKDEFLELKGFIGKPHQARPDKEQQVLFINQRYVRSEDISHAVYEGYHSMLFVNRHPLFVLNVTLNPTLVDVNIHPQKLEVKFAQKELVCEKISFAVRQCLEKHNLIPTMEFNFTSTLPQTNNQVHYPLEKSFQQTLMVKERSLLAEESYSSQSFVVRPVTQPTKLPVSTFPQFKLLGQIHRTYFIAETEDGVFFIDQHAAEERVLYEEFMEQYASKQVAIQHLLQSEIVEVSTSQRDLIEKSSDWFSKMGFTLEPFGGASYLLKTIPLIFGKVRGEELFLETLSFLEEKRNVVSEFEEVIVTRMACRAAVMAGEHLTNEQMEQILRKLAHKKLPYTCPHGRPTIIKTTIDELEKKFKRK